MEPLVTLFSLQSPLAIRQRNTENAVINSKQKDKILEENVNGNFRFHLEISAFLKEFNPAFQTHQCYRWSSFLSRLISHIPELSQHQDGFIHAISCMLTKCHLICRDFTFSYRFPLSDHRVISMWSEVGTEQFLTDQNWECLRESQNSKANKNYHGRKYYSPLNKIIKGIMRT